MTRCTAEERALARSILYRALALAFGYPHGEARQALREALEPVPLAAGLIDRDVAARAEAFVRALATEMEELEAGYQRVFTLTYSEECPPYETAFSARHIFQQTKQLADLSGLYRAFGVEPRGERPDHLSAELEFAYLLTLKEAEARSAGDADHVETARSAQRIFLRRHLARWAPLVAQRVIVAAGDSAYARVAALLAGFIAWEERFLRLGRVDRYRDEPVTIDDPGEFTCPLDEEGGVIAAGADSAGVPLSIATREEMLHVSGTPR